MLIDVNQEFTEKSSESGSGRGPCSIFRAAGEVRRLVEPAAFCLPCETTRLKGRSTSGRSDSQGTGRSPVTLSVTSDPSERRAIEAASRRHEASIFKLEAPVDIGLTRRAHEARHRRPTVELPCSDQPQPRPAARRGTGRRGASSPPA